MLGVCAGKEKHKCSAVAIPTSSSYVKEGSMLLLYNVSVGILRFVCKPALRLYASCILCNLSQICLVLLS